MKQLFEFLHVTGKLICAFALLLHILIPLLIHLTFWGFTIYIFISAWIEQDLGVAAILSGAMLFIIQPLLFSFFPLKTLSPELLKK